MPGNSGQLKREIDVLMDIASQDHPRRCPCGRLADHDGSMECIRREAARRSLWNRTIGRLREFFGSADQ